MAYDQKLNKTVLTNPIHFLAFGFGSGLAPFAPGTFGTLAAVPLYLLMINFEAHRGRLLVDSEEGAGTTVVITLRQSHQD